jgi:hypothetical protein
MRAKVSGWPTKFVNPRKKSTARKALVVAARLFDNLTLVTRPQRYDFVLLPRRDMEFGH